jgi:DNA-binding NarL/FixJ family response regulator
MTVIGQTERLEDTIAAVEESRPDVVILRSTPDADLAERELLLAACAGAKVLAIELYGSGGILHELCPRRRALAEFSAARLLEEIRAP